MNVNVAEASYKGGLLKPRKSPFAGLYTNMKKYWALYLLALPGFLWYIIFRFGPIWGIIIAFENYKPNLGILKSQWVGLANFKFFLTSPAFFTLIKNTLVLSVSHIVFGFPIPLLLALFLNEVRWNKYKRLVQTITYLPHFLSWVVISGVTFMLLSIDSGAVNVVLNQVFGIKIDFLSNKAWFVPVYVLQDIWKEAGWGTVIYLAAITGINVEMYESADLDGCGRLKKMFYITLPSIKNTIIILLLLRLSNILSSNFEQVFLLQNSLNIDVSEVFDTYVYREGVLHGYFSLATSIGLFSSLISIILLFTADRITKALGEDGIF